MPETINSFDHQHRFLSNFYPSPVLYEGITYPSAEHAYQAAKTTDLLLRATIAVMSTPGRAKQAGRFLSLRKDWEEIKVNIMREILQNKFSDLVLRQRLINTGDVLLKEGNYWHDNYWGECQCKSCSEKEAQNKLGELLVELRTKLQEGYKYVQ